MFTFITVIASMLVIICLHELGHYIAARACHIMPTGYSIGFGPVLISHKDKNGTLWAIRPVPLGGFCSFADEGEQSLQEMPPFKRVIISFAGPLVNLIIAAILTIVVLSAVPYPITGVSVASTTNSAVNKGDIIISVDGHQVSTSEEAVKALANADDTAQVVSVPRSNGTIAYSSTMVRGEDGKFGISVVSSHVQMNPLEAVNAIPNMIVSAGESYIGVFVSAITNQINLDDAVDSYSAADDTSIPNGKYSIPESAVQLNGEELQAALSVYSAEYAEALNIEHVYTALNGAAIISFMLFLLNMLPIPPLDGSGILIGLIEGIRKKRLNKNSIAIISVIGVIVVFGADISLFILMLIP